MPSGRIVQKSQKLSSPGAQLNKMTDPSGAHVGEKGPSGRALAVVLEGSAGERSVDGRQFARSLGLRSTRFTVALGSLCASAMNAASNMNSTIETAMCAA